MSDWILDLGSTVFPFLLGMTVPAARFLYDYFVRAEIRVDDSGPIGRGVVAKGLYVTSWTTSYAIIITNVGHRVAENLRCMVVGIEVKRPGSRTFEPVDCGTLYLSSALSQKEAGIVKSIPLLIPNASVVIGLAKVRFTYEVDTDETKTSVVFGESTPDDPLPTPAVKLHQTYRLIVDYFVPTADAWPLTAKSQCVGKNTYRMKIAVVHSDGRVQKPPTTINIDPAAYELATPFPPDWKMDQLHKLLT